jgi:hypothetical protein
MIIAEDCRVKRDFPHFQSHFPRAPGEELSAGRYVHLVMARLFLVQSGSSPVVQGFPGKKNFAGCEWGLLLAPLFFFFSFPFSYVLLF